MGLTPVGGLLAASALHLGFQAVVSAVVYPALAEAAPERWHATHAAHTRRMTPIVVPVYAALGTACLRVVMAGPRTPAVLLAVSGAAAAAGSTAFVAAPAHRRLGREGPTQVLLNRLRTADRVRLAGAAVAGGAALAAVAQT